MTDSLIVLDDSEPMKPGNSVEDKTLTTGKADTGSKLLAEPLLMVRIKF